MLKIWYPPPHSAPGLGAIHQLQSTRLNWLIIDQVRIPIGLETVGKLLQC